VREVFCFSAKLFYDSSKCGISLTIIAKAFEGTAHPYKANIVKFGGMSKIADLPEVKKALQKAKES